jgi:hypothetical protein
MDIWGSAGWLMEAAAVLVGFEFGRGVFEMMFAAF